MTRLARSRKAEGFRLKAVERFLLRTTACSLQPRGFTLLELIVVLSLMGVATTIGMVMFSRISDTWRQVTISTELNATADIIFNQVRQDLSEVVSAKLSGAAIKGTPQAVRDKRFFKVSLEDDQIVIPVEIVPGPDARLRRLDVKYYIDRKDGGSTLMRASTAPGAAEGSSGKVADGVLAMCIEYMGRQPGAAWQRGWTQAAAPSAVRVSVTLMDSVRTSEQAARKAVFPIRVD